MTQMTSQVQALKNVNTQQDDAIAAQDAARGTSYIRWGHQECPASAELVYTGIIAGSIHASAGSGANRLCMTAHPVWEEHPEVAHHNLALIYGSEYEVCPEAQCQLTPACAVCRVSRAASVLIPGTNRCPAGWTAEYSGYIMANGDFEPGASDYICVDASKGNYNGSSQANDNQNLLLCTHARCGALPCPPYVESVRAACVVCSK